MTTKEADKYGEIAQALKQIEAETAARVNGMPLEDPQPTEAPADIDFTGMYGYPCGYIPVSATFMETFREWAAENRFELQKYTINGGTAGGSLNSAHTSVMSEMKSLAHPEWPYTGTPHEWRVRIK